MWKNLNNVTSILCCLLSFLFLSLASFDPSIPSHLPCSYSQLIRKYSSEKEFFRFSRRLCAEFKDKASKQTQPHTVVYYPQPKLYYIFSWNPVTVQHTSVCSVFCNSFHFLCMITVSITEKGKKSWLILDNGFILI